MGIGDVVDGKVAEAAEPVEAPSIEAPEVEAAPAVETPEAETPPEAEAPAVPEPKEEAPRHIPLPTFLDMRDRAKAAEARLAELEKPQAAPEVPDPYDDPKGFAAHVERVAEAKATNNRFQMSDVIAKREYGEDTVKTATEWALEKAKADPVFANQYMREPHPIDWIVRQHKRESLVGQLPEDISSLDELIEREIAKRGLSAPPTTPVVETQQAPVTPPRSLASQSSKSGGVQDVPTGPLAALEAVFVR